jgi:small conductance mechanosensitive channel
MTLNFETLKASLVLYGLDVIYAAVLLIVGWYLSRIAEQFVTRVMSLTSHVKPDPLVTIFLASLARYAVLAVVGIAVLQLFGIQTASLVAVLGATSLAIGLALQGTLSNLAAGVMLLLFRPFHIGDDIEIAGKAGKVKALSLFMTELVMADNTQVLMPNGAVWGAPIINHSTYPGNGEVKVSFPVSAGRPAALISEQIASDLTNDGRLAPGNKPEIHITKVIDVPDPKHPFVELTVSAQVKPADVGAVKQSLLDRIGALIGGQIDSPSVQPAE